MEPMSERRLPAKLLKRVTSTNRDVRLRVIAELERISAAPDIGRAAAAHTALKGLTADDSRAVVEAAETALTRTTIRLEPRRVDFGDVLPGGSRVVAEVTVAGPPLARELTATAAGPGLRATLDGDRLRVSWLPSAGEFRGTVTLRGPAGVTELPVTGTVPAVPALPPVRRRTTAVVAASAAAVVVLLAGAWAVLGRQGERPALTAPVTAPASVTPPPLVVSTPQPRVVATIPVGAEPEGVVVSPDSRTVYVANQSSRVLSVIDVRTRRVTPVTLRNTARFVAVSRDGRTVFVSMYEQNLTGSGVAVVDAATRTVRGYLATGVQPFDLAVAPDDRLWVPIHGGRSVEIYSAGDQKPVGRVYVPKNPHSVAFSADGQRAFTPDHESNSMSVIDMRTNRRVATLAVSRAPHSVAVTPDGRKVVVAAYEAGAVDIVDAVTLRRTGPFPVGRSPQSVAVAADGQFAYTADEGDDTVSVVRVRDGQVTATVEVGGSPRTVAVAPDGRLAYVTNGHDNTVSVLDIAQVGP
jgi:YVTN family beta-propeller protein